jgi:SAM-dependent methyltransferase
VPVAEPASFWDARFAEPGFAYGTEPNAFLAGRLDGLPPGRLLLPGEGEGRNAVWAAGRGWRVEAFDASTIARDKALLLAAERGVSLEYRVGDLAELASAAPGSFDAVGLVFVHLPPPARTRVHRSLVAHLRPGGVLILEGFSKHQLERGTGGPRSLELLYDAAELAEDFRDLELEELSTCDAELDEGRHHRGVASVVRLVARRPYR